MCICSLCQSDIHITVWSSAIQSHIPSLSVIRNKPTTNTASRVDSYISKHAHNDTTSKFDDFGVQGRSTNNALLADNVTRQFRLSQMIFPEGRSGLLVESVNSDRQRANKECPTRHHIYLCLLSLSFTLQYRRFSIAWFGPHKTLPIQHTHTYCETSWSENHGGCENCVVCHRRAFPSQSKEHTHI